MTKFYLIIDGIDTCIKTFSTYYPSSQTSYKISVFPSDRFEQHEYDSYQAQPDLILTKKI